MPDRSSFALMVLPSHRCIRPIWEKGRFARWHVGIGRRGVIVTRYFNLRRYGSMEVALLMALAFRDEVDSKLPRLSQAERFATVRESNTSGVPGVIRVTYKPQQNKSDCWRAVINRKGHPRKVRSFAVSVHGEEGAYRLAVEARRQLLVQMLNEQTDDGCDGKASDALLQRPSLKEAPVENPYPPSLSCEIPGVHKLHSTAYAEDGSVYLNDYWCAWIAHPDGYGLRRRFPIKRLGEDEAKRRAIEQRRIWERQFRRSKSRKASKREFGTWQVPPGE